MISIYHKNRLPHNWLVYNITDRFLEKNSSKFHGHIFDLGCGEAPYREFFLKYAKQYTGVDWAGSLHETKADIAADLNKIIPVESDVADSVVSISVIEHLYDPETMLSEAYRILKPGGDLVVQVPWQWHIHEFPHDYFRYTPSGLSYLLQEAGFSDIRIEAQSGFFTTMVLKFNYFSTRFIAGREPMRLMLKWALTPLWYICQSIAPILDKADKDWDLESFGYFITAVKPHQSTIDKEV
ncbi:class I SAM-dependent methyltransferase [Marinobacter sp. M-5]|uniref:class I SAM-dependent methyltransferase n=1 Tax=Marinobacter sp. M-5 TaxID=3081089 RepID=UPI00293D07D4|nr:class I SAM-dependent methyltransferase [Marinobacter sp. M-5]MDV3503089.1 class I SAM-dependent methyltransferase [Marinobacter sp. M-5]